MTEAFVYQHKPLDASIVEAVLPIANWSEKGSNRFNKEKRTQERYPGSKEQLADKLIFFPITVHHGSHS